MRRAPRAPLAPSARFGRVAPLACAMLATTAIASCESRLTLGGGCTFTSECAEPNVCAGGRCRAECREDRDCPGGGDTCVRFGGTGGVCTPPATAVPCRLNSDCGAAARCDGGECHTECAVDTDCAGLGSCVAMTCTEAVQTPPTSDGGILPGDCTGGRVRCPLNLSECVDLTTSIDNCGVCGNGCSSGEVCRGGACFCDPPFVTCGATCDDLATDADHCGACGAACAGGGIEICSEGHCCLPSEAWCGAACIPITDDPANCGGCGLACGPGEGCRDGSCMAPNDTCEGATEIVLDGPVTRTVTTGGARWAGDSNSCSAAVDAYFRFTLSGPAIVAIDVRAAPGSEPAIGWVDASCAPTGAACGTLCDGDSSIDVLSVLAAGEHRFVVDCSFPSSDAVELTLMAMPLPGGVPFDEVPTTTSSFDGVISPGSASAGPCGATGGEHLYYWLECSTRGNQTTASTCTGDSTFDTVLGLYRSGAIVNCAPQAAGCTGTAGVSVDQIAGLYALHVAARDPASGGSYRLTVDRGP